MSAATLPPPPAACPRCNGSGVADRQPCGCRPASEQPTPTSTSTLETAVADILSRIKPRSDEQVRAAQFQFEVAPRMEGLGFESRFRQELAGWNNPQQEKVASAVAKLLCNVGAIVALVGLRGTGKTTIAAQLAVTRIQAWMDYHREQPEDRPDVALLGMPRYRKATDLVGTFKPLYADFGSINSDELAERRAYQCREWPLLIIDEWHECEDQKMKDRVLTDLIDRRYAARTDTLIISNQTPEEFKSKTNPSVLSRLGEHGRILPCNWQSMRRKDA